MTVMTEIQVAAWAGFARWKDFRAAVRDGRFPAPDRELPDGPRWDSEKLEKWLRRDEVEHDGDEKELISKARVMADRGKLRVGLPRPVSDRMLD